ncbi:Fimbrial protein [compost metagenome]
MKIAPVLLALLLWLAIVPESQALICTDRSGNTLLSLPVTVASIGNTAPAGSVVWQRTGTLNMLCWEERQGTSIGWLYFHFNPQTVTLNNDFSVVVRVQSTDNTLESGRLTDHYTGRSIDGCPTGTTCGIDKVNVSYGYTISIIKNTNAGPPRNGPLFDVDSLMVLQMNGSSLQAGRTNTLRVRLDNLDRLTHAPCSSTVGISPSTLDFGSIASANPRAGTEIRSLPFSITEQRDCPTQAYGLNGILREADGTLASNNSVLVPSNNRSVGISIIDAQDNDAIIPFRREFTLTPRTATASNTRQLRARLQWMTSATPQLGPFRAGATLDVFYR